MNNLNAFPALITGASRGLGASFALALSRHFHIVAVARTVGALEALDDKIQHQGGQATLCPIDINDKDGVCALCKALHERWGEIKLWIHTAIYAPTLSPAPHIDEKDLTKAFATNVSSTQRLISKLAPLMSAQSRVVFFDDKQAHGAFLGAYGASKKAQISLAKSWAEENANIGPKITILSPNPMPTAIRATFYPGENRQNFARPTDEANRLLKEILCLDRLAQTPNAG